MAGVLFAAVTPEIATGTSAKTLVQVAAASNVRAKVREFSVSFKGADSTASPVLVEVLRQATAGTMTSLAPVKINSSDDENLNVTAQHTATGEPTAGDVLVREEVHPQTGYTWQAPFGSEIVVPGGGRLGIRVTAAASVSATCRVVGEE